MEKKIEEKIESKVSKSIITKKSSFRDARVCIVKEVPSLVADVYSNKQTGDKAQHNFRG